MARKDSMPPNICSLPFEILGHICEMLDESDPSSVLSFALVCKKCYPVARTQLLRTITFHVTDSSRIGRQVRKCLEFLDSQDEDSFRLVRRVIITGHLKYEDEATDQPQHTILRPTDRLPYTRPQPTPEADEPYWSLHTPPSSLWHLNYEKLHHYLPARNEAAHGYGASGWELGHPPEVSRMEAVWRPLVDLLDRFPGLKSLDFDCSSPLPPSILGVLENRKPLPRLTMSKFKLNYEGPGPWSGGDPIRDYDLAVIKSPCLRRLCLAPDDMLDRDFPINDIVGTLLGCGVAPNLQEIKFATDIGDPIDELGVGGEDGGSDGATLPSGFGSLLPSPWRLRPKYERNLERLEICAEDTMSTTWRADEIRNPVLRAIGLNTRCMALRTLKLSQPVGLDALVYLMGWNPACLSHLTFCCDPSLFGDSADNLEYLKQVKKFIRNLDKLVSLEMIGWDHVTEPLVSAEPRWEDFPHASPFPPNLHTLLFTACAVRDIHRCVISVEEIECIAKFSPHIQDLSLILGRSMGDATEVAQYRAIGRFRELRNLTLTLDCLHSVYGWLGNEEYKQYKEYKAVPFPFSKLDPNDQLWRGRHSVDLVDLNHWNSGPPGPPPLVLPSRPWIRTKRIGINYEQLVNHAVDEKLASSIFETISRTQGSNFHGGDQTKPPRPFGLLERMLLRTTGDPSFKHGAWKRLHHDMCPFAIGLSRSFYIRVDKLSASRTTSGPSKAVGDDQTLPLIIREVGNKFGESEKRNIHKQWGSMECSKFLPYFKRLWVPTAEGESITRLWWQGERWEEWESFPLQLEG